MEAAAGSPPPDDRTRTWPPGRPLEAHRAVELACEACGLTWRVHDVLSGYRLRCECGAWVGVPPDEAATARLAAFHAAAIGHESVLHPSAQPPGIRHASSRPAAPTSSMQALSTSVPTGAQVTRGSLRHASHATRRRWIDRSLLELIAVVSAFWIPALAITFGFEGRRQALLMPFADVIAGLLVLLVGLGSLHHAFGALRPARLLLFVEALAAACLFVIAALGWTALLESVGWADDGLGYIVGELGLGLALFSIAVCPAVFEELAFRGIVQGRLTTLFGTRSGLVMTAVAFAFAHGVTTALPIHFLLALYLGWMRERSNSLYPGMLLHLVYNGGLVLAAYLA